MSVRNTQRHASASWLTGGVCGLLVASGLAIADYVQSRSVVSARPMVRTAEIRYQPRASPPVTQTAAWEAVTWPAELPKPLDLPRPIDLSRFVDAPPPEIRLADLPEADATKEERSRN